MSGQLHGQPALPPEKWIGGWVGPRAGLDATEEIKILLNRLIYPGSKLMYNINYNIRSSHCSYNAPCKEQKQSLGRCRQ
jgi:hypothetical protein